MIDRRELESFAQAFAASHPLNHVHLEKSGKSIRLFDAPLFGYAAADDPLFSAFRQPEVIGPHFLTPSDWLEDAQSVISFFLPFSEAVRLSNREQQAIPGEGWLYGRVEGQRFVNALCEALAQFIAGQNESVLVPCLAERFWTVSEPDLNGLSYTSNWSERHAAYACGLGTFGLSKGLITEKGIAGRFGSLITSWKTEPSSRRYTAVYEYCIRCGKCVQRCPGQAISLADGKSHSLCLAYQKSVLAQMLPRFGCGLCQTGVPCEHQRPFGK